MTHPFASMKWLAAIWLLVFIAGCAGNPFGDARVLPLSAAIRAGDVVAVNSHRPVRLAIAEFSDGREGQPGDEVGRIEKGGVVYGINGPELLADAAITEIVTRAMTAQFEAGGYQLVDAGDADFRLDGVVRDYHIVIGTRDRVVMKVQVDLRNAGSGDALWSGEIAQQDERFAGVGGNSSGTIVDFLTANLMKLTAKTYDATTTGLMRARADLFIDPEAVPAAGAAAGIKTLAQPVAAGAPEVVPTGATQGLLSVTTTPARAGVYVDGIYYGLTPLEIALPVGVHALRLVKQGYRVVEQKVAVRQGLTTELPLVLEP